MPFEIPHSVLNYRSFLIDLFPEKIEEIDMVLYKVANEYSDLTKNKNEVANKLERQILRSLERRVRLLTEKFRDLLILKKAVSDMRKKEKKYADILGALEKSVSRDLRRYAKRLAEEKLKIESIREYGLNRHEVMYAVPLAVLLLFCVGSFAGRCSCYG